MFGCVQWPLEVSERYVGYVILRGDAPETWRLYGFCYLYCWVLKFPLISPHLFFPHSGEDEICDEREQQNGAVELRAQC